MRRAVSLLNIYLANLYGKGNYIDATFGTEIFFNRRRISEQRIDFGELQRRAADFLLDLSGVKTVYTGRELLTGASNQASSAAQAAYFPQRSGDVIIVLRPGWRSIGADGQTTAPVTAARTDFRSSSTDAGSLAGRSVRRCASNIWRPRCRKRFAYALPVDVRTLRSFEWTFPTSSRMSENFHFPTGAFSA